MKPVALVLQESLNSHIDIPEYRPPRWESPIEESLWNALRYVGISVDTQVAFGSFRVDMVVSSRRNSNRAIIECDGAGYHHRIIDEFRDDELLELSALPIAHIYGEDIASSAERCALYIVERWFPEYMDTIGYSSALEMVYKGESKLHIDGCSGFFPVGHVRPVSGDLYPSCTDIKARALIRHMTETNHDHIFEDKKDDDLFLSIKNELRLHGLVGRKLSPQELAQAYIVVCLDEPDRSIELEKLHNFLKRLAISNANRCLASPAYAVESIH